MINTFESIKDKFLDRLPVQTRKDLMLSPETPVVDAVIATIYETLSEEVEQIKKDMRL